MFGLSDFELTVLLYNNVYRVGSSMTPSRTTEEDVQELADIVDVEGKLRRAEDLKVLNLALPKILAAERPKFPTRTPYDPTTDIAILADHIGPRISSEIDFDANTYFADLGTRIGSEFQNIRAEPDLTRTSSREVAYSGQVSGPSGNFVNVVIFRKLTHQQM